MKQRQEHDEDGYLLEDGDAAAEAAPAARRGLFDDYFDDEEGDAREAAAMDEARAAARPKSRLGGYAFGENALGLEGAYDRDTDEITYDTGPRVSPAFVATLATSIAEKFGVEISEGEQWASSPKERRLEYGDDLRFLSPDEATALILHEVGHILHTGEVGKAHDAAEPRRRLGAELYGAWLNGMEDPRVDTLMGGAFPHAWSVMAEAEAQMVAQLRAEMAEMEAHAAELETSSEAAAAKIAAAESAERQRIASDEQAKARPGAVAALAALMAEFPGVHPDDAAAAFAAANSGWLESPADGYRDPRANNAEGRKSARALKMLAGKLAAASAWIRLRTLAARAMLRFVGVVVPAPANPDAPGGGYAGGWAGYQSRRMYGYGRREFAGWNKEAKEKARRRYRRAKEDEEISERAAAAMRAAGLATLASTEDVAALLDGPVWDVIKHVVPPNFDGDRTQEDMSSGALGAEAQKAAGGTEAQRAAREARAGAKGANQYHRPGDRAEKVGDGVAGGKEGRILGEMDYRRAARDEAATIRASARAFRRAVKERAATAWSGAFRRGQRIAAGRIARAAFDPQAKPFDRRAAPKDYRFAVSVLIDRSGSMEGERSRFATRALAVVGETFEGAPGCAWEAVNFSSQWLIAKHFGAARDAKDVAFRMSLPTGGGTYMGSPVAQAVRRLAARPETCRALVLVTDGQPGDYQKTRDAIADALRRGVRVLAIGVDGAQTDHLAPPGGEARGFRPLALARVADLPAAVAEFCRDLTAARR